MTVRESAANCRWLPVGNKAWRSEMGWRPAADSLSCIRPMLRYRMLARLAPIERYVLGLAPKLGR